MTSLFTGKRIQLAAPREADADVMAVWYEDSAYERNLDTDFVRPRSADALREQGVPEDVVELRIRLLADDRLIGFVALHSLEWANQCAKLAIGIGDAASRGQGYASEAMALLLRYVFLELNLHRVGLDVIDYNDSAVRLYQRAGFVEEGRERERVFRDNKRYDLIFMGLLRGEWLARQEG